MAGLKIEELRRPADGGMYYSDVELCLDRDGNIVEAGSLASVQMLVGAGSCIPVNVARKYGLIADEAATPAPDEPAPPPPFPVPDLAAVAEAAKKSAAAAVKGAKGKQDKRRRGTSDK